MAIPTQLNSIYYNERQLDSIINTNFKDTASKQSLGNPQLLDKGQSGAEYYIIKRTVTGYVEVHESWDDVVVIRSGHGLLRTGKEVQGETEQSDKKPMRNWHGGVIVNANERRLNPGDFLIIPAMTAHQYIPDNNDSLTYWTIKINK